MKVTIVDRHAMDALYGTPAFNGVVLREVEIDDKCPVCDEPRGEPQKQRFHEWGQFYSADTWTNVCGHTDKYSDVLAEVASVEDRQ